MKALQEREKLFIKLLSEKALTASELIAKSGVAESTTYDMLKRLQRNGRVVKNKPKSGKSTYSPREK